MLLKGEHSRITWRPVRRFLGPCPEFLIQEVHAVWGPMTGISNKSLGGTSVLVENLTLKNAAAAAAKSLQSCLTLCDLIDGSPPGSPVPGILQARTLEWVVISFSSAWK